MSTTTEAPLIVPTASAVPSFATSVADPGALGLAGFALTTFVLSLANAGIISGAGAAVLGIALFYGGIAQLLAGMWEFVKGNTFGAVAFTSYGAFWLAFWWLLDNPAVEKEAGSAGVGAFLLAWTIFTAYMTIAAVKTSRVVLLVFVALTITFIALTIGAFSGNVGATHFGGIVGLITAGLAWYGSAASVTNSTWKRIVLPVGAAR
ncbi:MAG: acetate uptake transporter [Actinomycetota bacterium]|nr:acetate uptake transporter [Actinomycetota bacterium]